MDTELIKGTVPLLVLSMLSRRPMYGYEIVSTIKQRTNGLFRWKEGTLYPNLHRLQKEGLLRGEWQGAPGTRRRKYYHITRAGRAVLAEKKDLWTSFAEAMKAVLEESDEQGD